MAKPKTVITSVVWSHIIVTAVYVVMILPLVYGFGSANQWSDNIVVLMNSPIQQPVEKNVWIIEKHHNHIKNLLLAAKS